MGTKSNSSEEIKVQPYTVGYLARLYRVCPNTFKKWIDPHKKEIGARTGWYYTTKQVAIIFERLGEP